ncbi:MAG TPA: endolytic transglycosylase MltG [Candidatus Paceibacterota bacterium]|nr:endolytic transglycosylase MltG [Candidatus Paceibacterota bacterium]
MARRNKARLRRPHFFILFAAILVILIVMFFLLPSIVVWSQEHPMNTPFPVGVDPQHKIIKENDRASVLFKDSRYLNAAVAGAPGFFEMLSNTIASTALYQLMAGAGSVPHIITINPGVRKEQVAALFGKALKWDVSTQKMFTKLPPVSTDMLTEGTIAPGDYALSDNTSVLEVQTEVRNRFDDTVLSRYTPDIQKIVPLTQGLTIASIIERETSDPEEMRVISGIIWNRIFQGMKLQMDSTLQYAKANGKGTWWPQILPKDKYIDSPYNTYQNEGLPPGPISDPSTAAVLAALNPRKTSCLFYFHDDDGVFHCSDTYEQHVAALKKYYGQGR